METNEALKRALVAKTEEMIMNLFDQLEKLEDGDLQTLEQQVLTSCLALGNGLLEQVLNHASHQEPAAARRLGACGHRQRLVAQRPKQVLTLMGPLLVSRPYYQCQLLEPVQQASASCRHGEAPFDEVWGIQTGRTSPGVQKLISSLSASMTLTEATTVFTSLLPLSLSERQALNLLQPVGEELMRQEDEQVEQVFQAAAHKHSQRQEDHDATPIRRLYLEMDGVLARLRRGSVPMEEQERKRAGDVYREVKVGAVFEATRGRERSELAPGVFVDEPGPIKYIARRTKAEAFGPLLYQLAQKSGLERAEQVVILGDGAAWIWRLVAEHFPQAIQILDLYHAQEHLWKVANAVYGSGTSQGAVWAKAVGDLLSEGDIEEVVEHIEALPTIPPEPGASRSVPEIEADYFRTHAERMRYPLFRAQGMHLGSGIAEAACKTVVSTRAKRSGMRWTPAGLDAVLALRTAVLNRSYEAFWTQRRHRCA
jgi:Uncharacterised protein family (UPF0236)